jgi:hypothetical protein
MKSKTEQIKQHLLAGQTITGHQALLNFGVYRLSSVINRLRNRGIEIETVMIEDEKNRDVFARYFIPGTKTNN